MDRRGVAPAPAAVARNSSASSANDSPKLAQWSKSSSRRRASPLRANHRPQAPSQTRSLHASRSCSAGISRYGSLVATTRWSTSPRSRSLSHFHSSSSTIRRRSASRTRPARLSITTRRVPPKSRAWLQRTPSPVAPAVSASSSNTSVTSPPSRTGHQVLSSSSSSTERFPRCWWIQ